MRSEVWAWLREERVFFKNTPFYLFFKTAAAAAHLNDSDEETTTDAILVCSAVPGITDRLLLTKPGRHPSFLCNTDLHVPSKISL